MCQWHRVHGAWTWGTCGADRRRVIVFEMECLRSMVGVTRMDSQKLIGSIRVLRWFGHVERINEYLMARIVSMEEIN